MVQKVIAARIIVAALKHRYEPLFTAGSVILKVKSVFVFEKAVALVVWLLNAFIPTLNVISDFNFSATIYVFVSS